MKMVATLLSCGATTGVKTKEDRDVYSLSREDAREEVQELIKNEDRCTQLCTALCSEGDNTDPTCRGWDDGTEPTEETEMKQALAREEYSRHQQAKQPTSNPPGREGSLAQKTRTSLGKHIQRA